VTKELLKVPGMKAKREAKERLTEKAYGSKKIQKSDEQEKEA
jgi:hypothetical protein